MNIARGTAACMVTGLMTLSAAGVVRGQQTPATNGQSGTSQSASGQVAHDQQDASTDGSLARAIRQSTTSLRNADAAAGAGYALSGGCVSGPEEGAMGVHYVNASLVGDGVLDAARPEVLVYEPRNGQLQLVAVEYIVLAEQWDAAYEHPPVLQGQHFHFVPAPNRTGLPAYYELHVWAWKRNPHGTFADWNPNVKCDAYSPQ